MTVRQFEWHLRVHGATVSAWPPLARSGALALLGRDARVRNRLADTLAALDDEEAADDPCLLGRMQGRVCAQVARRVSAAPVLRWGMRSGALAACLAAGLWAGGVLDQERDPLATVQVAALDVLR